MRPKARIHERFRSLPHLLQGARERRHDTRHKEIVMVTDPIADMIVRIKNASDAKKLTAAIPYSKIKMAIAELLEREGFVKSVAKKGKKIGKSIEIGLVYEGSEPRVKGVERISKFSRRVYQKSKSIRSFKSGYGLTVLTTPKGILSDREAKAQNVGGEALFKIW
jgi:small subunit ribosomal protein S8